MRLIVLLFAVLFSPPSSLFAASSASRSTGVAPLSVHFVADITASTPSVHNFHDYEYSWDFGDTGAGTWGPDGLSRNVDKGPIAAHLYETAGSYTATLTVKNSAGTVIDTDTFSITVTDPETIYAGTLTTCISTGTDWTGCPSGANHLTTSTLSDFSTYAEAGERVLFRRGDSWTTSNQVAWGASDGPVTIGAYGTCTSPDAYGICSNAPSITLTGSGQFINLNFDRDWRVMDLAITGAKTVPNAVFGGWAFYNCTLSRLKITGFEMGITWTHYRQSDSQYMDGNSVYSCQVSDSYDMIVYVGGERLAVIGNNIHNSDTTHVLRVWLGYQGVISHNMLYGSSLTEGSGRHAIKLHGPSPPGVIGDVFYGDYATTGEAGLRYPTQFVVVSNNTIGRCGPYPISSGPQNGELDERITDVIIEKNTILGDYGGFFNDPSVLVSVGVLMEGSYQTARNNFIDLTGGGPDAIGVDAWLRGIEGGATGNVGMRVYNNTIYSQTAHTGEAKGVKVHPDVTDVVVRNNLSVFTAVGDDVAVDDMSSIATVSNNLATNAPAMVDPANATPLLRDYHLTASSPGTMVGAGYAVPVVDDYDGDLRGSTFDIGADEYEAEEEPPPVVNVIATGTQFSGCSMN